MKLFRKDGELIEVVAYPGETVHKGDYLMVMDETKELGLIVQVIDFEYIEVPGLLEDVIREGLFRDSIYIDGGGKYDRVTTLINDIKILKCKIRGATKNGRLINFIDDLPSRLSSEIYKVSPNQLLNMVRGEVKYPVKLGRDMSSNDFIVDAFHLDGSLTLITGMKGSGKSHLAKLLAYHFSRLGARFIILDINSEYVGLSEEEGIIVLEPGKNLIFDVEYLGKDTLINVFTNILGLPSVSVNLFGEIWDIAENRKEKITLDMLDKIANLYIKNLMVKDAIIHRLNALKSCRFIGEETTLDLNTIFKEGVRGYVINLRDLSSVEKKILVEILLSKLSKLLEKNVIPPFFLFAEEAHLYVRDTYWEDVVTRMRHFGLFMIFITNQPDSLGHMIFRQLDNIFIFRFLNDKDLEVLSRISAVDSDTVKSIVKDINRGSCLILGNVVSDMPVVIKVDKLSFKALGETKRIFQFTYS